MSRRPPADRSLVPAGLRLPTEPLSAVDFLRILNAWSLFCRAVRRLRAYETGLRESLRMLEFAAGHGAELGADGQRRAAAQVSLTVLDCLDRMDRWDAYVQAFEVFRGGIEFCRTYDTRATVEVAYHRKHMQPFIEGVVPGRPRFTLVHYLYIAAHRLRRIQAKLARARAGAAVENLLHDTAADLTPAEIMRRIREIYQLVAHTDRPLAESA